MNQKAVALLPARLDCENFPGTGLGVFVGEEGLAQTARRAFACSEASAGNKTVKRPRGSVEGE